MNTPFYSDPDPSPEDGARLPTDSEAAMWGELDGYLGLNFLDATTEPYRLSDFLEFEDGSAVENDYDNQNLKCPDLVTRYEKEK
jgi:hypothetical protein